MYLRKWTRMRYFDKISQIYKLHIRPPPEEYNALHRFPPTQDIGGMPSSKDKKNSLDIQLMFDLLKKYPDLKYTNGFYTPRSIVGSIEGNYIFDFVKHQKSLIKKGFTKEKAFEITEKKYQDQFNEKFDKLMFSKGLAYDNDARSLLSVAEQIAEAEARFKVNRVTRDAYLYTEARNEFEKTLKELEQEGIGEREENEVDNESENSLADEVLEPTLAFEKKYSRVLFKVVPRKGTTIEDPRNSNERKQVINEFIKNTKNMFKLYYERAAALDRLSGLTDKEIMKTIHTTPSQVKKYSKELLQKLKKFNIKLDKDGEVDFSECSHPNIVKKYKDDPTVKIALLQESLDYEFPHKEAQMELAKKLRAEHEEYKRSAERLQRMEAQTSKEVEMDHSVPEESPFHKQYGISYPRADPYKLQEEKQKKPISDINDSELLSPEATYRLFESYEERLARLEKKWLQSRLAALETGVEKPTVEERSNLLNQAVEKLRRVKFLIDQKNLENAKDLLFEEHRVFTTEELIVDAEVPAEKLSHYLKHPEEKRRLTAKEELDDDKMLRMIARKEIIEDTIQPFKDYKDQKLDEKDTREYAEIKIREKRLASMKRKVEETAAEKEGEGVPLDTDGEAKPADAKSEKKKLMEYIKQTAEKSAKKKEKKEAKKQIS